MKSSEKLLIRIMESFPDLKITPQHSIRRIRRGRHGISGGCWAWTITRPDGLDTASPSIGSEDTMADCLKADYLARYNSTRPPSICIVAEFNPK